MSNAKGLSLHIGLNAVDPKHYNGWSGPLNACEADAKDMMAIAKARGFTPQMLLTPQATHGAVLQAIKSAAQQLNSGDIFLLTNSSHGGQVPDISGDEIDRVDETWCLYDRQIIDDELDAAFALFKPGVRILVFSDSCHSGTSIKQIAMRTFYAQQSTTPVTRNMPSDVCLSVYSAHKEMYDADNVQAAKTKALVKASVILLSGCQDNQLSSDGTFNGAFTGAVKSVWNGGKFKGNYRQFCRAAGTIIGNPAQTPNYFPSGAADPVFAAQLPFTI